LPEAIREEPPAPSACALNGHARTAAIDKPIAARARIARVMVEDDAALEESIVVHMRDFDEAKARDAATSRSRAALIAQAKIIDGRTIATRARR